MRFYNYFILLAVIAGSSAYADQRVHEISKGSDAQKEYIERLKQSGILEQYKNQKDSPEYQQYETHARSISDNTLSNLAVSLERYTGATREESQLFFGQPTDSGKAIPDTLTGIFVSFSMTDHEIREAFKAAEEHGGELYFIGMHPEDQSITDTMVRLRNLMANSSTSANARFHPKAFEEFNITGVPAILHARKGVIGIVHGTMNFDYLKKSMDNMTGFNDFGLVGSTRPILEKNLLDTIKERLANIDGEGLKKKAIDNFWKKKQFVSIPAATKTEEFYINPTVKVNKDIVNPNGDVLARAGTVINPLETVPSQNTYILFNARDNRQLEWLDAHLKTSTYPGTVMVMTSELHKEDGWKHLAALREHFYREIYLIPQEMVDRFTITGLPAVVTTDNQKKLLKIKQISIKDEG